MLKWQRKNLPVFKNKCFEKREGRDTRGQAIWLRGAWRQEETCLTLIQTEGNTNEEG